MSTLAAPHRLPSMPPAPTVATLGRAVLVDLGPVALEVLVLEERAVAHLVARGRVLRAVPVGRA
jgi:hypothetical protein